MIAKETTRPLFSFVSLRRLSLLAVVCVSFFGTKIVSAQPVLSVTPAGTGNEGQLLWDVSIAPDASLFSETPSGFGGSLGMAIGFSIDAGSTFVDLEVNESDWPRVLPGNNPFTEDVTLGLSVPANQTHNAFVSLGSDFLTSDAPTRVITLGTLGNANTLRWGGNTIQAGTPFEYTGGRISQAGMDFDSYMGSVSVMSSTLDCNSDGRVSRDDVLCATADTIADTLIEAGFLAGDFNLNGMVAFPDFLQLSANFGRRNVGYTAGDADLNGEVTFADFLVLSANFGKTSAPVAVPEPTSLFGWLWLLVVVMRARKSMSR